MESTSSGPLSKRREYFGLLPRKDSEVGYTSYFRLKKYYCMLKSYYLNDSSISSVTLGRDSQLSMTQLIKKEKEFGEREGKGKTWDIIAHELSHSP
jgi:hypothetical protein